jgi:hypothetical protein
MEKLPISIETTKDQRQKPKDISQRPLLGSNRKNLIKQ